MVNEVASDFSGAADGNLIKSDYVEVDYENSATYIEVFDADKLIRMRKNFALHLLSRFRLENLSTGFKLNNFSCSQRLCR